MAIFASEKISKQTFGDRYRHFFHTLYALPDVKTTSARTPKECCSQNSVQHTHPPPPSHYWRPAGALILTLTLTLTVRNLVNSSLVRNLCIPQISWKSTRYGGENSTPPRSNQLELKMFTKHKPHASRRHRALPSPSHPLAATQWYCLLQSRPSKEPNMSLTVNLAQICSAVPEIFEWQRKWMKKTKNRTLLACSN